MCLLVCTDCMLIDVHGSYRYRSVYKRLHACVENCQCILPYYHVGPFYLRVMLVFLVGARLVCNVAYREEYRITFCNFYYVDF